MTYITNVAFRTPTPFPTYILFFPMNYIKKCWLKRWFRRTTWTTAILTVLIAMGYAFVNAIGAQHWRETQAMLKAEGETIDFRELMNEPIPENENFCAIPLLKNIAVVVDNHEQPESPEDKRKHLNSIKLPTPAKGVPTPQLAKADAGILTDFESWAHFLRNDASFHLPEDTGDAARDLLAGLAKDDAIVQELAAGLNRPKSQWTPEWKTRKIPEFHISIEQPHYSIMSGLVKAMALRLAVTTRVGDTAKAHETVRIMARLAQAHLNDPTLYGLIVGSSQVSRINSGIWEICASHLGTPEILGNLESELRNLDLKGFTLRALRSELATGVAAMQYAKQRPEKMRTMTEGETSDDGWFNHLYERSLPSGFFDANAAVLAESEFKFLIKPLREHGWMALQRSSKQLFQELAAMKITVENCSFIFLRAIAQMIIGSINKLIHTQAMLNQSIVACALERHWRKTGHYPDSLDAVGLADGQPLPLDPINDKPMGYSVSSNGRYSLWSIGFDGEDQGGHRNLSEREPVSLPFDAETYSGDWVWNFPFE